MCSTILTAILLSRFSEKWEHRISLILSVQALGDTDTLC